MRTETKIQSQRPPVVGTSAARAQMVYDTGLTKTHGSRAQTKLLYALGNEDRRNGSLIFFYDRRQAWISVKFGKNQGGRYPVLHGTTRVEGQLENVEPGQTHYRFKYLLEGIPTAQLYFEPSIGSNHPPPMTSPEVPSIVPVSTGPRPGLPVVHSNRENLYELWQTPSGAYGQQASASTASEGPQENLDIPPPAQDPLWNSHYCHIPPGSHETPWDPQNVPATSDTVWDANDRYMQSDSPPLTFPPTPPEGPGPQ
jgi:hypothetical protein